MSTTLITGGTVVNATGTATADVLVDGETIAAVLAPGSALLGFDLAGNVVGEMGSPEKEEVVIRELDLDMIRQVRNSWQFYRDRRPESYTSIPKP